MVSCWSLSFYISNNIPITIFYALVLKGTIVGVHLIGEGANELIQVGSILIHTKSDIQTVSNTPFAAVTLTGLYQQACDDALYKVKANSSYIKFPQ